MSKHFSFSSAVMAASVCSFLSATFVFAEPPELVFKLTPGAASHKERVILFPRDFSLGEILIGQNPLQREESMLRGAAKGVVKVPKDRYTIFVPAANFYKNPTLADRLPADAFDCLRFSASSLDDSEDGLCDRALAHAGRFKTAIVLDLDRSDATDAGAVHAVDLPELQKISAFSSMIEGKCFKQFASLKQLRILHLPSTAIQNENLQYLPAIARLQFLDLTHTGVGDAGMVGLAKCGQLIMLDLSENPDITDKSMKSLQTIKTLRALSLYGTSVSAAGVLQLKDLPLVRITLPAQNYSEAQMSALRKAFPRTLLVQNKGKRKAVDAETRTLFAPLR